ncbi:MAG: ABC transporter substrate-binding protein [Syntrophomonadaceae bacterium]|mgnify:CR=1 FL=1|nr:ABC transporter substrate-binding protein [Syntrophomonadaceae bacterium]
MKHKIKILILCIVSIFMLSGCTGGDLLQQREKKAAQSNTILIGVPVPMDFARENTKFLQGIELAVEDINAAGVNGKKIEVEIVDDKGIFKNAVDIAQMFSENTEMIAVIGHWYSDICIPIAKIYEEAGMLNIVPTVSNPELTEKGYKYVFQNITSDNEIARKICSHAKAQGYDKVVIYYEESSYGENLAYAIEAAAKKNEIKVVDRTAGLVTVDQFRKAHDKWKALEFDAVLLALNMPEGGKVISELRELNQEAGIIAADGLDVEHFSDELGDKAEGVVIVTTYSPGYLNSELQGFIDRYQKKFNDKPDIWAIQGYESLQLIACAIDATDSYSPTVIADYLHNMKKQKSILGTISFNEHGELEGRGIYTKVIIDGQTHYFN